MSSTIYITGAAGGLGTVVTQHLLGAGFAVHAVLQSEEQVPMLLGDELFNDRLSHTVANLTDEVSVAKSFDVCPQAPYGVVHLVGGIRAGRPISETSIDDFADMVDVNTRTTYLVIREAMRRLTHGAIVTIGARTVARPEVNKSLYAASKAAVASLTLSAAEEGRARNIRANCILPGILRTSANLEWASDGIEQSWTAPQDVANLVEYLCSEKSQGVTGTLIPMFGKMQG